MSSKDKTFVDKKLGELCTFKGGCAFPRELQGYTSGELPFIKVSDMNLPKNRWIIYKANNYISIQEAKQRKITSYPAFASIFAKIGEAIKADRVRMLSRETAIDNNMMAAIPKKGINSFYLFYLLQSLHLSRWEEGTALPYLKQGTLENIKVHVPLNPDYQLATVALLIYLDYLISLNLRINDYLAA